MTPESRAQAGDRSRRADTRVLREQTEAALRARPRFTIRVRVIGIFVLLFMFMAGITVTTIVFISRLTWKYELLEELDEYAFGLEQARRSEKNYFLYGSGISDALAHTHTARTHFERAAGQLQRAVGKTGFQSTSQILDEYEGLLQKLLESNGESDVAGGVETRRIQARLRKHGTQLLADAHVLLDRERLAVHSALQTIVWMSVMSLILMVFLMASATGYLIRAVMKPLSRFMGYADRIGKGDYSPITPARKYRDEFSELGLAINRMLGELKDHQEQLTQAKKMAAVGSLTSGIAHELNNPLNNIGMTAEALLEDFDDYSDEKKREMLDQIYIQVERASSTVRNLLDFTRKEQPAFTSLDVREVIQTTVKLAGNELSLAGVGVELELPEAPLEITGNPRNLQQVFLNLFLNAIQAMDGGGKLSVRAMHEGDFVRVDVSDTGIGIPREDLEKIFDPYFTTKEPGEGTGLGLSVSFGIIEKHGGRITVKSEVGEGTTFSVFLRKKVER